MSKRSITALVVGIAVLVLAFLLNPSPERHRAQIEETLASRSPLAGALGIGSLAAFASTYHSLGVASYTTAADRTLSIGFFGLIFVTE